MGVITNADYLSLAASYNSASAQLDGITDFYYDAAYTVVQLNAFDPEIDLLVPFYNAYQASIQAYASSPQAIIEAVRSLQRHVLTRATVIDTATYGSVYSDINDFYADQGAFASALGSNFAAQSAQAGYTVEAAYIA